MKYTYDPQDILRYFKTLVNTPSPVGYYVQMNPVISRLADDLGQSVAYDNKSTAYIALDGADTKYLTITDTGFAASGSVNYMNTDSNYPHNPYRYLAWR